MTNHRRFWLTGAAVVLAVFCATSPAWGAVRRYALVIGNNRGDAGEVELHYAESDAQRVYDVLKDLGRFEPADMVVLRGEEAPRAQATLIALNDRIRATIAAGADALLFVYYSGHAGADALHMAGTRFDFTQLEQLVRGSAATFRVLAVDACRSGALTRVKGGDSAPPFELRIDERLSEQGLVLLTSSAANEDAQESDMLKGSVFTHYFVSALLGAGDADGDGRVTLEEAYRYTYDATLRSTSATWAGEQHPTFRYELQGMGKVPIAELGSPAGVRASLVFPAGKTYLVLQGSESGPVVGEVTDRASARRLSVRAGRYFVRGRTRDALLEGELDASAGGEVDVDDGRLHRVEYARLVRKGEGARRAVHGPEAGYFVQSPLPNAAEPCQGAFAGYAVHLQSVSAAARLAGCHSGFANDILRASSDAMGGELRLAHAWDLPVVSVDLGLAGGAWWLQQSFSTQGVAPARSSAAGSVALSIGLVADIALGFSAFSETGLAAFVYQQEERAPGSVSLGPYFALREAAGVAKTW
jgi:hypothetical protein